MATQRIERRLAAVLAADIAGYSRLMGADEEGTLAQVKAHRRELIDPKTSEHRGRIVKTTGDGILIEFPSVIEAVSCAIAVQRGMLERNAGTPEEERITFRVGVNLGDIIVEDGDIHGDGVNISARLEGIAEPGGICISEDAFRQVRGKVDVEFEDIGEQSLKNIARPLRVYRVLAQKPVEARAPALPLPNKPSIAVLPFANMSGDPEQEYFADGMVEEIITALSRIRWLFVIARNSTFTYKGQAVGVKQVGRELGVRYVLQGSVRKAGGRVRITAQLIDATNSAHLWADRFEAGLAPRLRIHILVDYPLGPCDRSTWAQQPGVKTVELPMMRESARSPNWASFCFRRHPNRLILPPNRASEPVSEEGVTPKSRMSLGISFGKRKRQAGKCGSAKEMAG